MPDPARHDLTAWKNAPFVKTLTFSDEATGDPFDLTGLDVEMQVRLWQGAPDPPLVDLGVVVSGEGVRKVDAAQGEIEVRINRSTLETLYASLGENLPADFQYDLKIGPTNFTEVYLYGAFRVVTGVTR